MLFIGLQNSTDVLVRRLPFELMCRAVTAACIIIVKQLYF